MLHGLIAGAAGTTALNVATYLDMAVTGRGPSEVPAKSVEKTAAAAGISLGSGDARSNRKEALGQLMGFATGLGWGVIYGALRRNIPLPRAAAGTGLGVVVMASNDIPIVASGLSDPRTWGLHGWLSDVIPHLVYGWVTAAALEALED